MHGVVVAPGLQRGVREGRSVELWHLAAMHVRHASAASWQRPRACRDGPAALLGKAPPTLWSPLTQRCRGRESLPPLTEPWLSRRLAHACGLL